MFDQAGAVTVAVQVDGARRLVLPPKQPFETPYLVDLRRQNPGSWLAAPFFTLTSPKGSMVRVMAEPRFRKAEFVEVVLPDAPLKAKLVGYFWQLAGVTSSWRPGRPAGLRLPEHLPGPADAADHAGHGSVPRRSRRSGRPHRGLQPSRRDRPRRGRAGPDAGRPAGRSGLQGPPGRLGEAVAKINHDLRNMLTSAQMASDRLAALGDPKVAQALPRLERALDRAITLASDVMAYGKSKEPEPVARTIALRPALDMAAEDAGLTPQGVELQTVIGPASRCWPIPTNCTAS
jgi:signal transduction histidine kinase